MLHITGDRAVDELLSDDPLALVIAMVLDQQVPLERAFRSPFDLKERLGGTLDAATLASMDPDALATVFSERPALHRFPKSMAARVQEVCRVIVETYGGDAAAVWNSAAGGRELLANIEALPGFGEQKARIFVALLGKQLGVRPPGWEKAAAPFGEPRSFRSVADIDSPEALGRVREYKQRMKAKTRAKAEPRTGGSGRSKAPSRADAKTGGKAQSRAGAKTGGKAQSRAGARAGTSASSRAKPTARTGASKPG